MQEHNVGILLLPRLQSPLTDTDEPPTETRPAGLQLTGFRAPRSQTWEVSLFSKERLVATPPVTHPSPVSGIGTREPVYKLRL